MAALVAAFPKQNLHVADLPYRLSSWALDDPANVGLWLNEHGDLRAWAAMQTPFWCIDCICHPADEALYPHLLAWADRRARTAANTSSGRPAWFVNVFADQAARLRDLDGAGFASQAKVPKNAWSKVLMERPSQPVPDGSAPPTGYLIRPLAGEQEVAAYVDCHRSAFQSDSMQMGWRARTLRQPEYVPDLDLVAVAPGGALAGFCVCWLHRDAAGQISGQVEPIGVHADLRGLGLGRALLSEGLRRLQRHGATRVCVETDSHRDAAFGLYESAGFRVTRQVWVYRKDYGTA